MLRKRTGNLLVTLLFLIATACDRISPAPTAAPPAASPAPLAPIPPRVADRFPGRGDELRVDGAIDVYFDTPMDRASAEGAFSMAPAAAGTFEWLDDRTVRFTPRQPLERASRYTVTIGTGARSAAGLALAEPYTFAVNTVGLLEVTQVLPAPDTGEAPVDSPITVMFNRPVVALTTLAQQAALPQPLTLAPAVSGRGEWLNTSIYVFTPDAPLPGGTTFTGTVAAGLNDTTGGLLRDDFEWTFTTPPPAVVETQPFFGDVDIALTSVISVTFNQPMDRAATEAAFSLAADGDAAAGRFRWDDETNTLGFIPSRNLALDSLYTIRVDGSAAAVGGGATLGQAFASQFSTVEAPRILATRPADGEQSADVFGGFSIYFSSPMDVATLEDQITILPEPTQVFTYWSDFDKSFNLNWDFAPSTEYRVTLGPDMADPYGNTVGQPTTTVFSTRALDPNAFLKTNGDIGTFNAYVDTVVYANTRNLSQIDLALYQLDLPTFARLTGPDGFEARRAYAPDPAAQLRAWSVPIDSDLNANFLTQINLAADEGGALAPGLYMVTLDSPQLDQFSRNQKYFLSVAGANLTLKAGLDEALVWATDLQSGQPLANLPIEILDANLGVLASGRTNAQGLFETPLAGLEDLYATVYAVSQDGAGLASFAITALQWSSGIEPWDFNVQGDYFGRNYEVYFYTDRPLYRPGQTVNFRGVVRARDDARYTLPDLPPIPVSIFDDQGQEVYSSTLPLSDFGTLNGEFSLAAEAGTGYYNINAQLPGERDARTYGVGFQVAEYRKPEFQVSVTTAEPEVAQGATIEAEVNAAFFFGGPVSNAAVHWSLLTSAYSFQYQGPGGFFEFIDFDPTAGGFGPIFGAAGELVAEGDAQTDAEGKLSLQLPADIQDRPTSQTFTIEATVTDVNGQQVSGRTTLVVHQGEFYIGLRPERYVGQVGQAQPMNLVVSDWQSRPQAGQQLQVVVSEHEWFSVQEQDEFGNNVFTWDVRDTPIYTDTVTSGADGFARVAFTPQRGGTYKILATGTDAGGREVRASAFQWVSSGAYVNWRQDNNDRLALVADRPSYAPGDTAELLIPSPFQGETRALVTIERGRILQHEVITLASNSEVYRLPITADFAPDVFVSVVIVKGMEEDNPTPGFRLGLAQLRVSPEQQEVQLTLTPDKAEAGPGDTVTYDIAATDYQGSPVQAEFSLGVADLAALALAPPNAAPIMDVFYGVQPLGVRTALGLTLSVDRLNVQAAETKGGGGGGADQFFDVREEFLDTAYWNPSVVTNAQGRASVTVTLPDNLTSWRLDARGITANSLVGQSTVDIVATKDLLIRPSTPRFFVVGDRVELGAVINNNTDSAITARAALAAQGLALEGDPARTVEVPARGRVLVTWQATALDAPAADLTFSVSGGGLSDASKPTLGQPPDQLIPILKYAAPETVGTAGQLAGERSITEAIVLPRRFDASQGELSLTLDPSLAAGMTDGLRFLEHYPHECTEQIVSRFLPNVLTYRALRDLGISDPNLERNLSRLVSEGTQKLYARAHVDGGWGWWATDRSDAFVTAYVLFGLARAQEAGFTVSDQVIENAAIYLETQLRPPAQIEHTWQLNRQAFMLYALASSGRPEIGRTTQMYEERERLDTYARAYLALALHLIEPNEPARVTNLLADFGSEAILSASGAHWEEAGGRDWWNMNTDTRTTALVLAALVQIDPDNNLNANAVRWLMTARRAAGAWETTQETAWALIALTDWMAYSGELKPNYTYEATLNGSPLAAGQATVGNVREPVRLDVAVAQLLEEEANRLVVQRSAGDGQLYYTAHLTVYQPAAEVQALNRGVSVARQYTLPDETCGGPKQPPCPPITRAAAGQDVRVTLTIVAPNDLYYAVIEDPFPAGMEPVDTSLLTASVVGENPGYSDPFGPGWGWWWFSNTDLRDEKLVLFATYLPKGTYTYSYTLHASLPGRYNVLPSQANEFYFPEVFGRGDGMVFEVLAAP